MGGLLLLAGGVVVVVVHTRADAATPLLPPLSVSCRLPAAQLHLHTDHRYRRFPIFNVFSACRFKCLQQHTRVTLVAMCPLWLLVD